MSCKAVEDEIYNLFPDLFQGDQGSMALLATPLDPPDKAKPYTKATYSNFYKRETYNGAKNTRKNAWWTHMSQQVDFFCFF